MVCRRWRLGNTRQSRVAGSRGKPKRTRPGDLARSWGIGRRGHKSRGRWRATGETLAVEKKRRCRPKG
eukprot:11210570-Lingulodinium_polyedra.AAC.1